jgi:D-alanyl-D-alanine dipeptidase
MTLYDLKTGKPVTMPSLYDEMSERASPAYNRRHRRRAPTTRPPAGG